MTRLGLAAVILALVACKRPEPLVELKLEQYRWDGDGPNAFAHCRFILTSSADTPVFVDEGLRDSMVLWQEFDGTQWDSVEDFEVDENGNRVPHFHTRIIEPVPKRVSRSEPLIVESTIRRIRVQGKARLRVGIKCFEDAKPRSGQVGATFRGGQAIFSDEFTLATK